jgi:hypothetical protein
MSGGIEVSTVVRLYCNGRAHNHTRLVLHGRADPAEIRKAIREAGYQVMADGRVYCAKHRAGRA